MRVICIDDREDEFGYDDYQSGWHLVFGQIYTVLFPALGIGINGKKRPVYILKEDPDAPEYGHLQSKFAPLSTIDETEFERNYKKELV